MANYPIVIRVSGRCGNGPVLMGFNTAVVVHVVYSKGDFRCKSELEGNGMLGIQPVHVKSEIVRQVSVKAYVAHLQISDAGNFVDAVILLLSAEGLQVPGMPLEYHPQRLHLPVRPLPVGVEIIKFQDLPRYYGLFDASKLFLLRRGASPIGKVNINPIGSALFEE